MASQCARAERSIALRFALVLTQPGWVAGVAVVIAVGSGARGAGLGQRVEAAAVAHLVVAYLVVDRASIEAAAIAPATADLVRVDQVAGRGRVRALHPDAIPTVARDLVLHDPVGARIDDHHSVAGVVTDLVAAHLDVAGLVAEHDATVIIPHGVVAQRDVRSLVDDDA